MLKNRFKPEDQVLVSGSMATASVAFASEGAETPYIWAFAILFLSMALIAVPMRLWRTNWPPRDFVVAAGQISTGVGLSFFGMEIIQRTSGWWVLSGLAVSTVGLMYLALVFGGRLGNFLRDMFDLIRFVVRRYVMRRRDE